MEKMEQLKKILAQDQELVKKFAQKAKECTDRDQAIDMLAEVLEEKGVESSRDDIEEIEEQLGDLSEEQLEAVSGGSVEGGFTMVGLLTIGGLLIGCITGIPAIIEAFSD